MVRPCPRSATAKDQRCTRVHDEVPSSPPKLTRHGQASNPPLYLRTLRLLAPSCSMGKSMPVAISEPPPKSLQASTSAYATPGLAVWVTSALEHGSARDEMRMVHISRRLSVGILLARLLGL
jgi:hypothetical protein